MAKCAICGKSVKSGLVVEPECLNRAIVMPCEIGSIVYVIEPFAKTSTEILGITEKSGYRIKEYKFIGMVCICLDTKEFEYIVCDQYLKAIKYKNIYISYEVAQKALEGLI